MSTMTKATWNQVRMSVSVSVTLEGKILYRSIETGQFIAVRHDHGRLLLENLILDDMLHEEKEEDTMMGRVDSSEWISYGFDREVTALDPEGYDHHEGQVMPSHEEDVLSVSAPSQSWSFEDEIEELEEAAARASAAQKGYLSEKLDMAAKKMNSWAQQPWGPDMFEDERIEDIAMDTDTEAVFFQEEEEEAVPQSASKSPQGLFRPDRWWAARNARVRYSLGRFMAKVKEVVAEEKISNREKDKQIGRLLHQVIVSCYDRKWRIGKFSGYVAGSGRSSLRWGGAWLRTDIMLRSIVFWVTKNHDLAYSWGRNGEVAWNSNGGVPAKNKFLEEIGEIYNLRGFVPLQEFLKGSCLDYYLGK